MIIKQNEEEIKNFRASTLKEILEFDPQVGEKYIIQTIQMCPFTGIESVDDSEATVVKYFRISNSNFGTCFCFVDNYALDCYIPFENVKIIKCLD
jgi:hypothetical protein